MNYRVDGEFELCNDVPSGEVTAERVNETKKTMFTARIHQRRAHSNIYNGFIHANGKRVSLVSARQC